MKSTLLSLVSVFGLFTFTFAQPVLQPGNFPSTFSASYYDFNTTMTEGPSGANQTWNFSSIVPEIDPSQTTMNVPVNSAPFYENFPQANFCYKIFTEFYSVYFFAKVTTVNFEYLGITTADQVEEDYTTNTGIIFQLPYQFNSEFTDTFYDSVTDYTGSFTRTYDAYGTLITPFGTYNNVIRQKRVEVVDLETYTGYSWFNVNPFYEIMSYNTDGYGSFAGPAVLKTKDFAQSDFALFPNPTKGLLSMKPSMVEEVKQITIYNLQGKMIKQIAATNSTEISIQDLPNGIYIAELSGKNNKVLFVDKIIKE